MAAEQGQRPRNDTASLEFHKSSSYAFLNHSPDTLPNNLPPTVDDKPLARQKRRRTSPEDQVVLEAAYNYDSKPDKNARQQIVRQVALTEKEVQIWFQNRRQTSRRKSRPLLPHEVARYQLSRTTTMPLFSAGVDTQLSLQDVEVEVSSQSSPEPITVDEITLSTPAPASRRASLPVPEIDLVKPIGYLADRRSAATARSVHGDTQKQQNGSMLGSIPKLKRSSSSLRISMTSDGKAQVTTRDISSPSPPRPQPTAELQPPAQALMVRKPDFRPSSIQRSTSGRSQDSRTWEFWCDKDARRDLQETAARDSSGSAADAIGMLRSTSRRTVLGTISSRGNSASFRASLRSDWSKIHSQKRTLRRSQTMFDRCDNIHNDLSKMKKTSSLTKIPGNDSDKENWSPTSEVSAKSLTNPQSSPESLLEGHPLIPKQLGGELKRSGYRGCASSQGLREDAVVAEFMSGRRSKPGAEAADMDCVQGLLSLSQGNWR